MNNKIKSIVMVDELVAYEDITSGRAARHFGRGKESCHMVVAGDIEDLHALAIRIGLRREWFQSRSSWPHYDLTPNKRALALRLGAIEVPATTEARARIEVHRRIRAMLQAGELNHIKDRDEANAYMSQMLREYFNDDGSLSEEKLTLGSVVG